MSNVTREILIDAPGDKVWAILANIGSVQNYSPGVVKSYYTSDIKTGVGASRHCDLFPKGTVEERIVNWHDGERYAIEIYDWTEVPYTGVAHFTLKRAGIGTIVTQRMDYRPAKIPTNTLDNRSMEELVARVLEGNLWGLRHFVETGEVVTREVFKRSRSQKEIKMSGLMKIFVPMLEEAWSGQLISANIPFYAFNVRVVPVVDNPALFPLQPKEPVIPLIAIAVAVYVLWRGGGAWGLDLKASKKTFN